MPTMVRSLGERATDRQRIARGELPLHSPEPPNHRCDDPDLEAAIDAAKAADRAADGRYREAVSRVVALEGERLELRRQSEGLAGGMRDEARRLAIGARYAAAGERLKGAERALLAVRAEASEVRGAYLALVKQREALKRAAHLPTLGQLMAENRRYNRAKAAGGSSDSADAPFIVSDPRAVARSYTNPGPAAAPEPPRRRRI